ncbi:MAG: heparinase II/III family protein [Bacteroidales bacterium]|nr:heparinase II/III family protein [Bacteroidales bacterium]
MTNHILQLTLATLMFFSCTGIAAEIVPGSPGKGAAQLVPVKIPDPPKKHPRLYLRQDDLPEVRARVESPDGQRIIRALRKAAVPRTPEEEAKEDRSGFRYYMRMRGLTSQAQLDAIDYLLYDDREAGRRAIDGMLDSLKHTNFGTRNDMSRASGIMLMVGGLVYDWCYPLLSKEEKKAFYSEFIRIAGTMECHYPPKRDEYLAGHGSEWMILRDMLSAGIAVYDEYPDMFNYVREMLEQKYIPIRNYLYGGRNYHQGTDYGNVRLSCDFISLWILDRMGARNLYSPDMRYVLYDYIYRRRPDGKMLPAGDVNHNRAYIDTYPVPMMLASSYWKDPYLAGEWELKPSVEPHCLIFNLLWRDFNLQGRSPEGLPLTMYSPSPYGWMVARTGWDENSVIAEMKVNEQFFGNHQHQDGGAFQIYYKGPLAIDSGIYQSVQGGYNSLNNKNYTKRTIAHNSLLVYDPDEVFECWAYGGENKTRTAANDGGQRLCGEGWNTCRSYEDLMSDEYTVGRVLAHNFGPSEKVPVYTYMKGDITQAYSKKVRDVRRSFVFFNLRNNTVPAAMIVYDHLEATNPDFKKTWLLHSIEEPEIEGRSFYVRRTTCGDSGMLRCESLLPENGVIEKIGGPGKEFLVDGINYPADPQPNRPDPAGERGAWRVEVSPATASAEDCFLHVMQVADNGCTSFSKVSAIEGEDVCGAVVAGHGALFHKKSETLKGSFSFSLKSDCYLLVCDLEPGNWTVIRDGKTIQKNAKSEMGNGTLWLRTEPGTYTFTKK